MPHELQSYACLQGDALTFAVNHCNANIQHAALNH